jgi:hypothetical protein
MGGGWRGRTFKGRKGTVGGKKGENLKPFQKRGIVAEIMLK